MSLSLLKSHGQPKKWIHVICGPGHPDVHPAIQLNVLRQPVRKTNVHGADPARIAFSADKAEKFNVAIQCPVNLMTHSDCPDEFEMTAVAARVADAIELCHRAHGPSSRQFNPYRKNDATFEAVRC